jgi:hypothetical protein
LRSTIHPVCLYVTHEGFLGKFNWREGRIFRGIKFESWGIHIKDRWEGFSGLPAGLLPGGAFKRLPVARGYGKLAVEIRSEDFEGIQATLQRANVGL